MPKKLNIPLPPERLTDPPENADGTPHFTYFNEEYDISFVWSGDFDHAIQVCPNGYGEPAAWALRVEEDSWVKYFEYSGAAESEGGATPAFWLKAFAWFCEQFIEGAAEMTIPEDYDKDSEEKLVLVKDLPEQS